MAGTSVGEFFLNINVDAGKGELTLSGLVTQMGELEVASVGEIAVLAELALKIAEVTEKRWAGHRATSGVCRADRGRSGATRGSRRRRLSRA